MDPIISAFVLMYGDKLSRSQIRTRHKISNQTLHTYMNREKDPHPAYSEQRGEFLLTTSEEWFKKNKLGAYKF